MPRSTILEDKYNNVNSGLVATTYQGAIDELSANSSGPVLNENDFASNSPTRAPSQSSTAAYIRFRKFEQQDLGITTAANGSDYNITNLLDGKSKIINFKAPIENIDFTRRVIVDAGTTLIQIVPYSYTTFSGPFIVYPGQSWLFSRNNNVITASLINTDVLNSKDLIQNSSWIPPSQKSVKEYIEGICYKEIFINSNTILEDDFKLDGQIKRYKILPSITLTPPTGFSILAWDPNVSDYVDLGVDQFFTTDNLNTNIYEVFRYGTNIYINNVHPYTKSLIKLVSNTTTDAATNYNTANWLPVTFSDGSSLIRVGNRYPFRINNSTFSPNYNGYFTISHNLHLRSNGQRVHLSSRIFNTVTNQVVTVSDYTYIRATGGHNLDTLKLSTLDIPCVAGQAYQLQLKRQGTSTNSTTLDNANQSFITIKSITF